MFQPDEGRAREIVNPFTRSPFAWCRRNCDARWVVTTWRKPQSAIDGVEVESFSTEIPADPEEHAAVYFVARVLDGTHKFLVAW